MSREDRNEAEKQFSLLFHQAAIQKDYLKKLQDDDLLLVCCLMAEIVKKLQPAPKNGG